MPEPIAPSIDSTSQVPDSPPLEDLFRQALKYHKSGNLFEAGSIYQAILQAHPEHAEANYNLGLIAVEAGHPEAGLPYFEAALNTDPTCQYFWLSYIDALSLTGKSDEAQSVLSLAREHGLSGDKVEALAARLTSNTSAASETIATSHENSAVSGPEVSLQREEMLALLSMHSQNNYVELERLAQLATRRCPKDPFGWKMLGIASQSLGDDRAAIPPMLSAIELDPYDVESHYNLGVIFQNIDQFESAASCYQQALALNPRYIDAALNLGVTYHRLGKLEEAEKFLRQAIEIRPDFVMALGNLAVTLQSLEKNDEAEVCLRRIIEITPGDAIAYNNLGVLLQKQERHAESAVYFEKALDNAPEYVDAHANLAISLNKQDRLSDAEASMRLALRGRPNDAKLHNNLALMLQAQGKLDEADEAMQQALQISAKDIEVLGNRANLLRHMGRLDQAAACYREAIHLSPDNADLLNHLGGVCYQLRNYDSAEICQREALQLAPEREDISTALGITHFFQGKLDLAQARFTKLLEKLPDNPSVLHNLGLVLQALGRLDEAVGYFRKAHQLVPNNATFHSTWLYCLLLGESNDIDLVNQEHFRFGEQFEPPFQEHRIQHAETDNPRRPLRVGFVSADLCNHAVFNFLEPVLNHINQHSDITLHAYYNNYVNDSESRHLKNYFNHWSDIANLPDYPLAKQIHEDNIDILIDLSGHTAGNRLLTFAFKPAPVQVSWIGYPATTGLRTMDYYLADRYLLPPDRFDDQFTEKIARLPAAAPFIPHAHAPAINALPALENGYLTFGSFNRPNKLSRNVIAVWARILHELPDAKMRIGGLAQENSCQHIFQWFTDEGIAPERLTLLPRAGMYQYLQHHHQIDICLDTFPHNGGTTTHHALWMGVPTLTLAGTNLVGRVGTAILSHAGLQAFIAESPNELVELALYWSNHLAELASLRTNMREQLQNSSLRNPEIVARCLVTALRTMWERRCTGLPPESFEVPLPGTS